jgi:hypothetical protein
MPLQGHEAPSGTARRVIAVGLTVSLTAVALVVALRVGEDNGVESTSPQIPAFSTSRTVRSAVAPSDVVSRLREILRIREAAYRTRNPDLLRSIYSIDCPCLESDERAILQLLDHGYEWDGIKTSIEIRSVDRIHERLWTVVALFRSEALRIETAEGQLVRREPAGSDLFKFTLIRPPGEQDWLLGLASVI